MGCQTKEWTEKSNKNIYFFHTICYNVIIKKIKEKRRKAYEKNEQETD